MASVESEPGFAWEHCCRCPAEFEGALVREMPETLPGLAGAESMAVWWLVTEARAYSKLAEISLRDDLQGPEQTQKWLTKAAEKLEKAALTLRGELPAEPPQFGTYVGP